MKQSRNWLFWKQIEVKSGRVFMRAKKRKGGILNGLGQKW